MSNFIVPLILGILIGVGALFGYSSLNPPLQTQTLTTVRPIEYVSTTTITSTTIIKTFTSITSTWSTTCSTVVP